ncbi:MAG TPA: hypothetical protein VNT99_08315 [Methylomirabilota bacterium]|nr:hypothetical protein [Methylomirabilota bacterium]
MSVIGAENELLADSAADIKRRWDRFDRNDRVRKSSGKAGVVDAIAIGEELLKVRLQLGHGRWLRWFGNCLAERSIQTANEYMFLSKHQHAGDLRECSSIREALAVIRGGRPVVELNAAAGTVTITFAIAQRCVAGSNKLSIEQALLFSLPEQLQLRHSLEHAHNLYLALPTPPTQS